MVSIETTSTTTPPPTLPAGEKPYYTPQKTIYSAPYNPPEQAALSKWVASALPRDGLVALALTKQVKALYTGTIVVAIKGHDCAADVNLQLFQGKKGPTVLITDNYAARPSDMTNYGEVTGPDMYSSPRPIFVHGDTDLALTTPDQETQVTAPSNSVNTVIGGILELNDNACENLPPPTTTTTTTLP
jgi:hypothetical protein